MAKTPDSFPSKEEIAASYEHILSIEDCLKDPRFSAKEKKDMERQYWGEMSMFATIMANLYRDLFPTYSQTWNGLRTARKEAEDLGIRLQRQVQVSVDAASLRKERDDLRQELEALKSTVADARTDSTVDKSEKDDLRAQLRQLQADKDQLESRMDMERKLYALEVSDVYKSSAKQAENLEQSTKHLTELQEERIGQQATLEKLSGELKDARRLAEKYRLGKSRLDRTHQKVQQNLKEARKSQAQTEHDKENLAKHTTSLAERLQQVEEQHAKQAIALHEKLPPFVVVFIDADGYVVRLPPPILFTSVSGEWELTFRQFEQSLLQEGEKGGWKAADQIVNAVRSILSDVDASLGGAEIILQAYAGMERLASFLLRHNHINEDNDLYQFVTGMNARRPLFDCVDVGWGKERADNKITGKCFLSPIFVLPVLMAGNRVVATLHEHTTVPARSPSLRPRQWLHAATPEVRVRAGKEEVNHTHRTPQYACRYPGVRVPSG
ncbi:MAG: hypothetical protein LQ338_005732 [Usnochroma carphineum]|nr:MAG: hypothetical protein LQ338_005732 [Usnochroma carphineum]